MRAARAAFAVAAALLGVAVAVSAAVLPDDVALHFAGDGTPDRFGTRGELLLLEAGAGVGLAALFVLLTRVVRRVPLDLVNVPHPEHWKSPAREPELRRRMETDLLVIGAATLGLVAGVAGLTARAALSDDGRLSPLSWVLLAAYLAAVLGLCVWSVGWRYRPPATTGEGVGGQGA